MTNLSVPLHYRPKPNTGHLRVTFAPISSLGEGDPAHHKALCNIATGIFICGVADATLRAGQEIMEWCMDTMHYLPRAVFLSDLDFSTSAYRGRFKKQMCWARESRHIEFEKPGDAVAFCLRFWTLVEGPNAADELAEFEFGKVEMSEGMYAYMTHYGTRQDYLDLDGVVRTSHSVPHPCPPRRPFGGSWAADARHRFYS